MPFGVPGLRKLAFSLLLVAFSVTWLSCGSYKAPNASRVRFRAVISNSQHPVTSGVHVPALEIMDATTDKLSFSPIGLSALPDLGPLMVASNKTLTLAYSPGGHMFELVNNSNETASGSPVTIPDATESFFLANNILHVYAAVPNAQVAGGIPGAVIQIDVATGAISATIPVPHVRFIREVNRGDFILALSDNSGGICAPESGAVTLIKPTEIGSSTDPRIKTFCGFDHPAGVGLTDNLLQPLVLQCGIECGGTGGAAVIPVNLVDSTLGTPIPVRAATVATGTGNTLYVAGTAPGTVCASGTAAGSCGTLTTVDVTGANATKSVEIPDGHHDKMEITSDGQVVVGSSSCSEINTAAEIRGCLGIFNPATGKVVVPPLNGNVTGIAPIPSRKVFYAIQGGNLAVYDTTTDKFLPDHQTAIVGELVDVKVIDNAP
jgi:hypothetical protein